MSCRTPTSRWLRIECLVTGDLNLWIGDTFVQACSNILGVAPCRVLKTERSAMSRKNMLMVLLVESVPLPSATDAKRALHGKIVDGYTVSVRGDICAEEVTTCPDILWDLLLVLQDVSLNQSAAQIQAAIRGRRTRDVNQAAHRIQSMVHTHTAKQLLAQLIAKQELDLACELLLNLEQQTIQRSLSAPYIQGAARGRADRIEIKREHQRERQRLNTSATFVQGAMQGARTRLGVQAELNMAELDAAERIGGMMRGSMVRTILYVEDEAAGRLQSAMRGTHERRRMQAERSSLESVAAECIGAALRSSFTREIVNLQQDYLNYSSASHLQGALVGRVWRQEVGAQQAAAQLQGGIRGSLMRQRLEVARGLKGHAGQQVGARVRGALARKEVKQRRTGVEVAAQAQLDGGVRGWRTRNKVARMIQIGYNFEKARVCIAREAEAALRVQGGMRGAQARQDVAMHRQCIEKDMVLRLQSGIHGALIRRPFGARLRSVRMVAATRLQGNSNPSTASLPVYVVFASACWFYQSAWPVPSLKRDYNACP